jgi:hypothetical protein
VGAIDTVETMMKFVKEPPKKLVVVMTIFSESRFNKVALDVY